MNSGQQTNDWKQSVLSNKLLMYFLIGGVASVIDVGLFIILYEWIGTSALVAHSISIPVSAIYSFTCNAVFNFRTTDRILSRLISFSTVVALGYGLGALIIWMVVSYTGFGGTVGKLMSLPAVFFFQFFLNSRISFKA